jgi:hypothetical protein
MKKFLALALISAILFSTPYCKKSNDTGNTGNTGNSSNPKPVATSVGAPAGTGTNKYIPTTGGSIASADGKLEIEVPGGALAAGDTITIQPITNNCPGGLGLAYRLGPDGSKFNQPVTLKFHYDDSVLNETSPGFMLLAYQDKSGIWFVLDNAKNDTVNHILSGTTTHFTDFTWFSDVILNPNSASLKVNETVHLNIQITASEKTVDQNGNSGYALLRGNSSTWAVNGVTNGNDQYGKITIVPNAATQLYDYVTYTAPKTIPPQNKNPVLISAEFDQLFLAETPDGGTEAVNKVILYAHIYLYDINYHVKINFEADSVNESGAYYNWKDQGSFDVVFAGTSGHITNINNSDAVFEFDGNISTCTVSLTSPGAGPIQIQDSGIVAVNPFAGNITVSFNRSLNPAYFITGPVWNYSCPGSGSGQLGGGSGPSFPTYVQFNIDSSNVQTTTAGQYTIEVSPMK